MISDTETAVNNTLKTVPAEVRALIVKQLGAALAEAWRRQQPVPESQPDHQQAAAS